MYDINFIDKSFDSGQSNLYHLSIQIGLDGFAYAILDVPKGKYTVLKSVNFFLKRPRLLFMKVRELLNEDEHLNLKFKSVDILYATDKFTLVPTAFFHHLYTEKYFGFNHELEKGYAVEKTQLHRADAWCIFGIPDNLKELLFLKYPKATLRHNLYPLVERTMKELKVHPDKDQVHLNFFRTSFEIVVLSGQKLLLCNQFNYSGETDILYYVLYVFDQLKLSPESTELIIHGKFLQTDATYQAIRKYIRKPLFAKPTSLFSYSYTFSQLPDHFFTTLLDHHKCE